ncbi:MAG: hypothetical protein WCO53_02150 [Deltaproteobacteria bacterium]
MSPREGTRRISHDNFSFSESGMKSRLKYLKVKEEEAHEHH